MIFDDLFAIVATCAANRTSSVQQYVDNGNVERLIDETEVGLDVAQVVRTELEQPDRLSRACERGARSISGSHVTAQEKAVRPRTGLVAVYDFTLAGILQAHRPRRLKVVEAGNALDWHFRLHGRLLIRSEVSAIFRRVLVGLHFQLESLFDVANATTHIENQAIGSPSRDREPVRCGEINNLLIVVRCGAKLFRELFNGEELPVLGLAGL